MSDHQDDFDIANVADDDDNEATLLARVPDELLGALRAPPAEEGSSEVEADAIEEETTMRQPDGVVEALLAADASMAADEETIDGADLIEEEAPASRPERKAVDAAPSFPDEQDASAHLVGTQQRDAWAERAAWLRAEAEAIEDKAARARALVAVCELYAMAGEEQTARAIAAEVRTLAPSSPLAHHQLRGLLMRDQDWQGALEVLDSEARVLPTNAARAHAAMLGSDIARVRLEDDDGAKKRLDVAQRVDAADPRPFVQRFTEALGDATDPSAFTKVRAPETKDLSALRDAFSKVSIHRGNAPRGVRNVVSTYDALLRARAALESGDVSSAVATLGRLQSAASLKGGAGWLASMLAAARKETRGNAIEALRGALDGTHDADARRALAARAIELGDAQAARSAIEGSDTIAFSAGDRLALTALTGGSREVFEQAVEAAAGDDDLIPLLAASSAVTRDLENPSTNLIGAGATAARAGAALGRALGALRADDKPLTSNDALAASILGYTEFVPESGTGRALTLELDLEGKAGAKIANAVAGWRGEQAEGDRDGALAAALLAELAGNTKLANESYARARAADSAHEAAARAAAASAEPTEAATILSELSQSMQPGTRAALVLTEAANRLLELDSPGSTIEDERDKLLRGAAEMDPHMPLSIHIGEGIARSAGDRDGLIEWLHARRESCEDPIEQARDYLREALITPEGAGHATGLLTHALKARPDDIGLRELFERLSPERPSDRAAFRAERAAASTGAEAARCALDAALEYERDGDLANASVMAKQATLAGENLLAPLCVYRTALAGHGTGELVESLLAHAKATEDPTERLETYERLAELDEVGRNDPGNALLWRRAILEGAPSHLPTLRRIASTLIIAGRDEELEPVVFATAKTLEGPEAIAHAQLAARLRLRLRGWDDTREAVDVAYKNQPRGIWALRQTAAHARAGGDEALALEVDVELAARTERSSEVSTLSLRAAESAERTGNLEKARELLDKAIEATPSHFVLHLERARVLEALGNFADAAESYEAAAQTSITPEERVQGLYKAAVLFADKANDSERARGAFEHVFSTDPSYRDVFQRLKDVYVATNARAELAALLERRLETITDPAERVDMEIMRGRALADIGDAGAAKRALAAALEQYPDHVEALSAFAEVSAKEEDWEGAEQAWIRLARLVSEPERQSDLYLRLGELYDGPLPNAERAELSYQEVLKRFPDNEAAREKLVELYKKTGDTAKALEQQTILINNVEDPEAKCRRTTGLASIYEAMGDTKKAEQTLLQARKTWPKDDTALHALASFYQRTDQAQAANVLLERAVADARRALGTGRFEPYLFSTVATVAELRGKPAQARIARASVAALDGAEVEINGAGEAAGDATLDDLLAPDIMTPAFRDLLQRTGSLLDSAVTFDIASVRGMPLPPPQAELADEIKSIARAYGIGDVKIYQSAALGAVCVPASSHPATIVLGQPLVASENAAVRTFLIHRALKVIQTNASAFSRTAPIDLWPLLAAYLKALNTAFSPQGVDPAKLADASAKIAKAMPANVDPQVRTLATDVIGSIGNRASTLNTAINGWGARAGLLAVGDPNVALAGIAWAGGHTNQPPASGKERLTWIGRNAEARELIVFSVSDAYSDARSRLGLD
ncbi:MAG: tetratricopeptide repeat protein [Polyangiaceae bacterium]|nr:tetratricopeptide repeat protein [Polyangiaceae bacterium]